VLTPGGLGTIFGSDLAAQQFFAAGLPLPYVLGGIEVRVDGIPAALTYVSETQINFQVPRGIGSSGVARIVVIRDGLDGETHEVAVQEDAFGIFVYRRSDGVVDPIIVHADNQLVTPENPARPDEIVIAYGTGVSGITNAPADAEPSPAGPPATCATTPVVTLKTDEASAPVEVLYCGLTANFASLVQLNLRLPVSRPPGSNLRLCVRFGDAEESAPVTLQFAE
jgi:uncharacterized protein (TIGR03437 family)